MTMAPEERTALAAAVQKFPRLGIDTAPSGIPAWRTLPTHYLISVQDRARPAAPQYELAARMGAETAEWPTGHGPMYSRPKDLALYLDMIARNPFKESQEVSNMSSEANKKAVLAAIDKATGRRNQVHRVLAQGDLVVTHATATLPDGGQAAAFDLWRIADGRIIGHWCYHEPIFARTANGHTQVDGATDIDPAADTQATRTLVEDTVRTILVDNDFSDLERYLA